MRIPKTIDAYVRWLDNRDGAPETLLQVVTGGRYLPSTERARKVRALVADPDQALARWSRLLAPHVRKAPPSSEQAVEIVDAAGDGSGRPAVALAVR